MKNDVISPEFDENGRAMRRIRSFVRRQGRLTKGQQHALDNIWPVMGVEYQAEVLDIDALFGRAPDRDAEADDDRRGHDDLDHHPGLVADLAEGAPVGGDPADDRVDVVAGRGRRRRGGVREERGHGVCRAMQSLQCRHDDRLPPVPGR